MRQNNILNFLIYSSYLILMNFASHANPKNFFFTGIDGNIINLNDYRGHPILIVNTASLCGYTYQYEQLEKVHKKFKDKGLIVIGIPSNDFGSQELEDETKVKEFCELNYKISFMLSAITKIKNKNGHPFFQWVKKQGGYLSFPKWNFYKYLIDKNGKLAGWFTSFTEPNSKKMIKLIERIL